MPGDDQLGSTRPDWDARDINKDSMIALLISVYAGPASDGGIAERMWEWPIDADDWPDEQRKDAEMCRFLCGWLGYTQVDWLWIVHRTCALSRERRFRELQALIAAELQRCELLLKPELIALAARTQKYA